jgi:glycerol transport system substrate-binding protein
MPTARPKWRMAPSPHGPYWEEGMKLGYQDCGSWTFMKSTPLERRKAAWLFAQFCVAKTTSLKKAHVGLTPIRDSDIHHQSFTDRAPQTGRSGGILP